MGDENVNYALAQPYESQSSYFGMNNQFDLFGKTVNLKGRTFRSYAMIKDEPVKVKLKPKVIMKSLWGKIAVGLAVVGCVACVAAYGASLIFTAGASAVLAPAIVGGLALAVGYVQVMNKANEDIENQSESGWLSYMWAGAKGAYTGAEIGFALVTVGQLAYGILATLTAGGGGASLSFAGVGGTISIALEAEGAIVAKGAIEVVLGGALGLDIVNALEAAATGGGGEYKPLVNRKGDKYPEIEVDGYGKVPTPKGPYTPNNSKSLRSKFTESYKKQFKEWWIAQGRPWPKGEVNIHHIKPLSKGGDNSFENLVPLVQPAEHQPFTNWWRSFP